MRFALSSLVQVLPALFYFCDWKEAQGRLNEYQLPKLIATALSQILLGTRGSRDMDSPLPDTPQLHGAQIQLLPMFSSWRVALAQGKPRSFAVACALELLGYWSYRGIDVSSLEMLKDWEEGLTVGNMISLHLEDLDDLIDHAPDVAYVRVIATALATNQKPSLPELSQAILRSALGGTCALLTCNRRVCTDGQALMACQGGCCRLAKYCCKEHQRKHWKEHKPFCVHNKLGE
jgi:hypothetical protein